MDIKLDRGDYVGDLTPHANFAFSTLKGGGSAYAWNCHHPCLFLPPPRYFCISCAPVEIAPFDRFSCFMAQKTCFRDRYGLFGCEQKMLIIYTIFRKNTRNSLFPQCKSSIGNNSGSVENTAVKIAHSTGFSGITDRIVWPPFSSHDRKWPRQPIRRITAPWPRVNGGIQAKN